MHRKMVVHLWSGRRDLNPRLQPWQGCTLPLSYSRRVIFPLTLRVMEAASRFELEMEVLQTSALPLGYAAIFLWSGRRDLNPRLQPWQGCTLPLSYSRSTQKSSIDFTHRCQQGFSGKRHFSLRKKFLLYITSYYSIQRIHPHSSSGAAQQSRGAFHPAS